MDKSVKTAKVMAAALVAACVFFIVAYIVFAEAADRLVGITVEQAFYTLYAYGGVTVAGLLAAALAMLAGGRRKEALFKVFVWIALLFSFQYGAQFFVNIFNLRVMAFHDALIYLADYLPSLIMTVVFALLITQWEKENKKTVHTVAWVGLLFSVFLAGWFIYYMAALAPGDGVEKAYKVAYRIGYALVPPCAGGLVFFLTGAGNALGKIFAAKAPEAGGTTE